MPEDAGDPAGGRTGRFSPRLYLIVGILLVALPPAGYLSASWYTTRLREAEACFQEPLREFAAGRRISYCVAFSPDGRRALSGSGDGLWLLNLEGDEGIDLWPECDVRSVAFSPDGARALAGTYEGEIRLWDIEGGSAIRALSGRELKEVFSVAFSPDGKRALSGGKLMADTEEIGYGEGVVQLWDLESGDELRIFGTGHRERVISVAFTPDGRRALAGSREGYIIQWDLESGERLGEVDICGGTNAVSIAFSADKRRALSASADGKVLLWDLKTGEELGSLAGERPQANDACPVTLSPDGRRALVGGYDVDLASRYRASLTLWDLGTCRLIRAYRFPMGEEEERAVAAVAFSPDGRHALSGGVLFPGGYIKDPDLRLWRLPDEFGYWLLGTKEE